MDESFYVIPSVASPSMKALQSENATLKLELQSTKTRLSQAEKAIKTRQEQERILRDSIISVRKEVMSYLLCTQSVLK
jgi:regulator of replication initiation timing